MEYIAGEEKLELTSDGAELIARLADGALRDALSILDTCAGVTAKIDADAKVWKIIWEICCLSGLIMM